MRKVPLCASLCPLFQVKEAPGTFLLPEHAINKVTCSILISNLRETVKYYFRDLDGKGGGINPKTLTPRNFCFF